MTRFKKIYDNCCWLLIEIMIKYIMTPKHCQDLAKIYHSASLQALFYSFNLLFLYFTGNERQALRVTLGRLNVPLPMTSLLPALPEDELLQDSLQQENIGKPTG